FASQRFDSAPTVQAKFGAVPIFQHPHSCVPRSHSCERPAQIDNMLQVISLLVENKPGALMRITGVLSARGYNIESLTVARTLDPELSRMSIVVDIEPTQRVQVTKQINKLVNVLQVSDLQEGS